MVGSQGVEPRVSQGRLVYSQLQSPMLLATHASGADEGARTPGLDVGNVAFYQLNYIRRSSMMFVRSDSLGGAWTCIEIWSGGRGSNPRHRVWKIRALPAELHPQNSERVRPSCVNMLQKISSAPDSHPHHRTQTHIACWTRMRASHTGECRRVVRRKGESP